MQFSSLRWRRKAGAGCRRHTLLRCTFYGADGGTRCASITAGNIALRLAIRRLIESGECLPMELRPSSDSKSHDTVNPTLNAEQKKAHENAVMPENLAAISVGLIGDEVYLDLDYQLDSNADVDMNVVGLSNGQFVEIQGTGEESTYSREQFNSLMDSAEEGLQSLFQMQEAVLQEIA